MGKAKKKKKQQKAAKIIARVAGGIGLGMVAGLTGTVIMTAAQMIEMQLSGRQPSDTPYKAMQKTFGIEAQSDQDKQLITNATHFAYGTTWGIPRGVLAAWGTNGATGTSIHFGAVWATALSLLPAMKVAEPVTTWKPRAIASDVLLHGVYAIATGLAADALAKWLRRAYKKS